MEGKIVLITGASSAIGRSTACHLAERGAAVVLTSRDPLRGESCVQQVRAAGGEANFVPADLTRADDAAGLVKAVIERYGRLDYAVNNAGGTLGVAGPIADCPEDAWDTVVDVNLKTLWLSLKYELLQMRHQGSGAIVNTIAVLGYRAVPNLSAYVASKHAAVGLTSAAALEAAQYGVRVNGVAPGMSRRIEPTDQERSREARASEVVPMGRLAETDEIAEAAAWLCSEQSSFVNGHVLVVDGGWLAKI